MSTNDNGSVGDGAGREPVRKTYKLYVGGAFVRSESGYALRQNDVNGAFFANCAKASRKDLRDAIGAARKAFDGWSTRSAFNRSQILFRLAEMIEGRRATFVDLLGSLCGRDRAAADREVSAVIDRVFWYAGWCDKFTQVLGGVNPIASPYNNFTVAEPTGVVVLLAPRSAGLIGLITSLLPALCAGNTCVLVADDDLPVIALELGEALATSDVPAGAVNVLSGTTTELLPHAADHMDVNAIGSFGRSTEDERDLGQRAASNIKRVAVFAARSQDEWCDSSAQSPYWIERFVEWKTSWHPVGV